jgi:hypothetical protein
VLARAVVDRDLVAVPREDVQRVRGACGRHEGPDLVGIVDDALAVADGEHDELLARDLRDGHALLDAGAAPLAEHDEAGAQAREVGAVVADPRREALVVGLGREHRRATLGVEPIVGDLDGAIGAVQLDLGPVTDDRERQVLVSEGGERANDVVKELDAPPGHMCGHHGRSLRL